MSLILGESGLFLFLKVLEHFRDYKISFFKPILLSFKMVGGQDISMTESLESKLDAIVNAIINALIILSQRTVEIEGAFAKMHNNGAFGVVQFTIHQPQDSVAEEVAFLVV